MDRDRTRRPSSRALRFIAVGAAAALTTVGLAACGTSASGGSAAGGVLTVQVQTGQIPAFQMVAKEFERQHKGVTVKLQTLTDEQKITTNGQILASNSAPDVGIVPTNAQSFTDLVKAKQLIPLDDVWKKSDLQSRYGGAVADSLKSNGKPYVVLFDKVLYNVIFYNKTAFQRAGVTAPADRQIGSDADLYKLTDALKAKGYEGVAIGGNAGYKWGWVLDAQLFANAPKASFDDFTTSWQNGHTQKVPYTSADFIDSIAHIKQWYSKGVFPKGALGQSDDQAQASFIAGKAAMILDGSFSPPVLDTAKPDFEYDWLLLPGATAGSATVPTAYAGDTFAISKQAKHQALAKEWLELYVSDKMQAAEAKITGALPAVDSVDPNSIPSLGKLVQSIVGYTKDKEAGVGWTSVLPGGLGQAYIDPQIQKLLGGQQSLVQVGQNQQKQFQTFKSTNG